LLAQIEDVCDRVAILDRGRLIVEGSLDELVGQRDKQALIVDPLPATEIEALRGWLASRGHALNAVEQPRARLDQLFLSKISRPGANGGASAGVGSNEVPLDDKPKS
jgi:ABC-2 type transport system ATP-binding protein